MQHLALKLMGLRWVDGIGGCVPRETYEESSRSALIARINNEKADYKTIKADRVKASSG